MTIVHIVEKDCVHPKFEYFCNNMKRVCVDCGEWFEFDQSLKKWVKE